MKLAKFFALITCLFSMSAEAASLKDLTVKSYEIETIRRKIHIGELVAEIQSRLEKIYDETIIEKVNGKSRSTLAAGAISFKDFVIPFLISQENTYSYDRTEFVLRNSEEVAVFDIKKSRDLMHLKKTVNQYLDRTSDDLARIKKIGIEALEIAGDLIHQGERVPEDLVDRILRQTLELNFLGRHDVVICVTKNHAENAAASTSKTDFQASGFSMNLESNESYREAEAYSQTLCNRSENTVSVGQENARDAVNLTLLDRQLREWAYIVHAQFYFQQQELGGFPSFGNKFYPRANTPVKVR